MNILIAGASGFIGKILYKALSPKHDITVIGRDFAKLERSFPKNVNKLTFSELAHHDAINYDLIINLSGSNIGAKRWSQSSKKELVQSRTSTNQILIDWLIAKGAKPRFFCANAVGIYGAYENNSHCFDEFSSLPSRTDDFLQEISLAWEQSLQKAIDASIPVTTLRFGVVLKKGEGMLKKLELPFYCGLGSVLGSGQQVLSWVHYQDLLDAINFLIEKPDVTGPVNITSPLPVSQKEFAGEFAKVINRKLLFTTPSWLVKLMFGEMGEYLLLKGQNVAPKRLTDMGFQFSYKTISAALAQEYSKLG